MRVILKQDSPEAMNLCYTCHLDDCRHQSPECPLQILKHGREDNPKELVIALLEEKDKHIALRDKIRVEIKRVKGLLDSAKLRLDQRKALLEIARLRGLEREQQDIIKILSFVGIAKKLEISQSTVRTIDRNRKK